MFAARETASLPQGFDAGLMALRDRRPFRTARPRSPGTPAQVSDPNYRVEVAEDGLHVYNRDGHHAALDPFELFPKLGVEATGRTRSISGSSWRGRRWRTSSASATRRTTSWTGAWRPRRPRATRSTSWCRAARWRTRRERRRRRGGRRLMPFIRESVVTTLNADGTAHVAPLG
jgi:hypothetical protein